MKNITLTILEREKAYGTRLAAYISDHGRSPFSVKLFLVHPAAEKDLAGSDIILICSSLLELYGDDIGGGSLIVLDEDGSRREGRTIYKYQSAEKIYRQLIAYCLEKGDKKINYASPRDGELETEIYFLPLSSESSDGRMKKALASLAAEKKLLYMDFRQIALADEGSGEQEGEDFSDLIYYLKQRSENMGARIESSVKRGAYDSIAPPQLISDLWDLDGDDWMFFLETLRKESSYQLLIFDFGNSLPQGALASLVDRIVVLSGGTVWEDGVVNNLKVLLGRMGGEELAGKLTMNNN